MTRYRLLAVLLVAVLALAGCGGRSTPEPAAQPTTPAPAVAAEAVPEPAEEAAEEPAAAPEVESAPEQAAGETEAPAEAAPAGAATLFPITDAAGKYGFVNAAGEVVIEPRYDYVDRFFEGRAAVMLGDKWGFIDETGTEIAALQFDGVMPFSEGMAGVSRAVCGA